MWSGISVTHTWTVFSEFHVRISDFQHVNAQLEQSEMENAVTVTRNFWRPHSVTQPATRFRSPDCAQGCLCLSIIYTVALGYKTVLSQWAAAAFRSALSKEEKVQLVWRATCGRRGTKSTKWKFTKIRDMFSLKI